MDDLGTDVMPCFDPLLESMTALDIAMASASSPEGVALRQRHRLSRLIDVAKRGSSWYRRSLQGICAESATLGGLPVVTRQELMQSFDAWVTDPRLNLSALRAFVSDPERIAEPYLGDYTVWESSGSSGVPGIFVQDAGAMAVYDALEAERHSMMEKIQSWLLPPFQNQKIALIGVIGGHFASIVSVQRLRRLNPWMNHAIRVFSILQSTRSLVNELNEFAPSIIATYPTVAALLADESLNGNLHVNPQHVWTGGETLSKAVRGHLELALGVTVRNSYGASEFLSIAWECAHGRLHVNSDWVILEPVDERRRPTPPGKLSDSTLLTNLANTVQPLIRYDIGDQIIVQPQPCTCGSALPVIDVAGRHDDSLKFHGLDGKSVTLLPLALTTVLEEQAGIFNFRSFVESTVIFQVIAKFSLPQ